ncbi:MAG TPA: hypothetical protein VFN09_06805 [Rhodanobacteraceae bacterium]|nr:hypothetical protein [Rhodanobacteraceae bacterium]
MLDRQVGERQPDLALGAGDHASVTMTAHYSRQHRGDRVTPAK